MEFQLQRKEYGKYCGMLAQSSNSEDSIDSRYYEMAMQTRPLLGNSFVTVQ